MATPAPSVDQLQPGTVTVEALFVLQRAQPHPSRVSRPALGSVDQEIEQCWSIRHRLLPLPKHNPKAPSFNLIFVADRLRMEYDKAPRLLKRALRSRKREQTLDMLGRAEAAAQAGDSKLLYGMLKIMCTGQSVQKIRLRSPNCWLMSARHRRSVTCLFSTLNSCLMDLSFLNAHCNQPLSI